MRSQSSSCQTNLILSGFERDISLAAILDLCGQVILVIILQFVTGVGEQDIVRDKVPKVVGESSESLISELLVHLLELCQFLVETKIIDGSSGDSASQACCPRTLALTDGVSVPLSSSPVGFSTENKSLKSTCFPSFLTVFTTDERTCMAFLSDLLTCFSLMLNSSSVLLSLI